MSSRHSVACQVEYRSASRIGESDGDINRKRIRWSSSIHILNDTCSFDLLLFEL